MSFDFHTWDYKLNSSFKEILSSVMQYFFLLCPYLISGPWSQKVLGEPGWTIVLLALVLREYYPDAGRLYTFFSFWVGESEHEWGRVRGKGNPKHAQFPSWNPMQCSSHKLQNMARAETKGQMLNQMSHPGAPESLCISEFTQFHAV